MGTQGSRPHLTEIWEPHTQSTHTGEGRRVKKILQEDNGQCLDCAQTCPEVHGSAFGQADRSSSLQLRVPASAGSLCTAPCRPQTSSLANALVCGRLHGARPPSALLRNKQEKYQQNTGQGAVIGGHKMQVINKHNRKSRKLK